MPGFHIPGVGLNLIKERKQFLGAGGFVSVRVRSPCAISCFFPSPHYAQQLLVKIRNCPTALRSTVMPGRVI